MGNAATRQDTTREPTDTRLTELSSVLFMLDTLREELDTLWRYRRMLLQQLRAYMQMQLMSAQCDAAAECLVSAHRDPTAPPEQLAQPISKSFGLLRDRVGAVEMTLRPQPVDFFVALPDSVVPTMNIEQAESARAWFQRQVESFEHRAETCVTGLQDARRKLYVATTPLTALEGMLPADRESLEALRGQISTRLSDLSIELHKSA